jgi:hypothetical protein
VPRSAFSPLILPREEAAGLPSSAEEKFKAFTEILKVVTWPAILVWLVMIVFGAEAILVLGIWLRARPRWRRSPRVGDGNRPVSHNAQIAAFYRAIHIGCPKNSTHCCR